MKKKTLFHVKVMTSITEIDLEPFGIEGILCSDFQIDCLDSESIRHGIRNLNFLGNTRSFRLFGITYIAIELLYEDEYGNKTYRCVAPDGSEYAVKSCRVSGQADLLWFLKECLLQILVVEVSKFQHNGPFAPALYEIAFDQEKSELLIRFEKMRNSLDNLLEVMTADEETDIIALATQQLDTAKEFLFTALQFAIHEPHSHIMYICSQDDERLWRFTDFSKSIVNFHGLSIQGRMWEIK